jgi:hypothetical protein
VVGLCWFRRMVCTLRPCSYRTPHTTCVRRQWRRPAILAGDLLSVALGLFLPLWRGISSADGCAWLLHWVQTFQALVVGRATRFISLSGYRYHIRRSARYGYSTFGGMIECPSPQDLATC